VTFTHRSVPDTLPPEIATCLYRVAQEALRNVAKHAHAARVVMRLARVEGYLHLSIKDSGVGFTAGQRRGLGLASMQERVRAVSGSLSLRSRPGYGTYIFVRVPIPETCTSGADLA
jgi:two-component system sensor histidine kinase UhpB